MEDINTILGAALEARGLTTEQSSSLIKAIHQMLTASRYYVTIDEHEEELRKVEEILGYHLQIVEEYRRREKQCCVGGCVDTRTTEEAFLPVLETNIYLCEIHRDRGV